jgi:hypothetical protein
MKDSAKRTWQPLLFRAVFMMQDKVQMERVFSVTSSSSAMQLLKAETRFAINSFPAGSYFVKQFSVCILPIVQKRIFP